MATPVSIDRAFHAMFVARLGNSPAADEVAGVRSLWEAAFADVPDAALAQAVVAYVRTAEFWPPPGAIRKLIPNPRLDADRGAWRHIAAAGGRLSLSPAHQRAAIAAGVPSAYDMRLMSIADSKHVERRFLAACGEPESLALSIDAPAPKQIGGRL